MIFDALDTVIQKDIRKKKCIHTHTQKTHTQRTYMCTGVEAGCPGARESSDSLCTVLVAVQVFGSQIRYSPAYVVSRRVVASCIIM